MFTVLMHFWEWIWFFFQTKQRSQWPTRRLCVSFIYYCNHFYLFVVRLFCLLIIYLVLHGGGGCIDLFSCSFLRCCWFSIIIIIIISLDTSPPSISASVTTDNKRTSVGVLFDTHTHRTLSTVTHTQVQSSSRSHTQTSTPVAHTHDHTSTGSTLTHSRISTPVISTQDQTSTDSTLTHPRSHPPPNLAHRIKHLPIPLSPET